MCKRVKKILKKANFYSLSLLKESNLYKINYNNKKLTS